MNTTNWAQLETTEPAAFQSKMDQFIELRAKGLSLGKISQQIGVPKSTLCDWGSRNARLLERLRRVELEALEERIVGSQQQQLTGLFNTLKTLDQAFAAKLEDFQDDLSLSDLFWMASNLRHHIRSLRDQPFTHETDGSPHDAKFVGTVRTNPDDFPPPNSTCP